MRHFKNGFLLLLLSFSIFACQKDESQHKVVNNSKAKIRTNSLFSDTTGWEIVSVNNAFNITNDSLINNFIQIYGQPDYLHAFQKRNIDLKITTVPVIKNNNLSGVLKIYHTNEDSVRANFFSIENINAAIDVELDTRDFQLYKGAVQSLVIVNLLRNEPIDPKYINWLSENLDRSDERVRWFCIEEWDCGGHTGTMTGWSYSSTSFANQTGFNQGSGGCILISRECWIEHTPREFGNTNFGGGSIDWNNYIPGNRGNSGVSNTGNNDIRTLEQIKLDNAKECIKKAGIKGVMAEAKIKDKIKYLCGTTYNDLLMQAYDNLVEQGKDCSDINAVMEMMTDITGAVESNTSWASQELKDYYSEILKNNSLVDPCNHNSNTEFILNSIKSSLCGKDNVTIEEFKEELAKEFKIDKNDLPFDVDPCSNKTKDEILAEIIALANTLPGQCGVENFALAFSSYFDTSNQQDPEQATLSLTNKICPEFFEFFEDPRNEGEFVGVENLKVTLINPINGNVLKTFTTNIKFLIKMTEPALPGCDKREFLAKAINQAIINLNAYINSAGFPIKEPAYDWQGVFKKEVNKLLYDNIIGSDCATLNTINVLVTLTNYTKYCNRNYKKFTKTNVTEACE